MIESHIDFQMAPINREGSCAENGDIIADTIAGAGQQSHSHHPEQSRCRCALRNDPPSRRFARKLRAGSLTSLRSRVRRLRISFTKNPDLKLPTDLLLKVLGGTSVSYEDMETSVRQQFNYAHQSEIDEISTKSRWSTLITTEDPSTTTEYLFEE